MNTAIIVAAGSGTRFNSEKPKQFVDLNGKPVLAHTLERFQACNDVDAVVVVLAEEHQPYFVELLNENPQITKVSFVVLGGRTRAESVRNGLNGVDPATEVVLVHDGARPLVTVGEIERVIAKAKGTGAACLTAAVTDTIKQIDGDRIVGTVDRRELRRALTPQGFKLEILQKAFENADALDEPVSDESYLVEQLGVKVASVSGSSRNIKITHSEDLLIAEALLKDGNS